MVAGHQLTARLGWTSAPEGSLAEQFLHAEATNLQLGAGMSLLHVSRAACGLRAGFRSFREGKVDRNRCIRSKKYFWFSCPANGRRNRGRKIGLRNRFLHGRLCRIAPPPAFLYDDEPCHG
ncbi:MAG: hypothetical protein U1F57_11310 [bacterium]